MNGTPITFESVRALSAALVILAFAVVVTWYRRPALPVVSKVLGAVGLLLLAVAAGEPMWHRPSGNDVVVMVDLSPSTRGAGYRDRAVLRARVASLLGGRPYRLLYFAGAEPVPDATQDAQTGRLSDLSARRTVFAPPAAAAVILFSDARFEVPALAPPTHVVVDPALDQTADAAVERLEVRGDEVAVTVRNGGAARTLSLTGTSGPTGAIDVPPGGIIVTRRISPPATAVSRLTARLSAADDWPENDSLTAIPPPAPTADRWWVSASGVADAADWRGIRPQDLPSDANAYMVPSVIVLENVSADSLTDTQQQRLRQYVRDLGGGLLILGGDRAFAAGGYAGTSLDALSPLASHPPRPASHWVFLVDSSGSMNAPAGGGATRWRVAAEAAARAAAALPPNDLLSVAGFSAQVEWWVRRRPAAEARAVSLPPAGARPAGPTELARALETVATSDTAEGPPVELVVLTDANAPVEDPAGLADLMRRHKVRLHLLALGDDAAQGLAALRQVVEATGGALLREPEPAAWARTVRRVTRAAEPGLLGTGPLRLEFVGALAGTPPRTVPPPWNHTWLKPQGSALAVTGAGDVRQVAAAQWPVGEGRVVAAGFGAAPGDAEALVRLVARAPADPRLRVVWEPGARLGVTVDAVDATEGAALGSRVLNGLQLSLQLRDAEAPDAATPWDGTPVPQVAPGRYEVAVEVPPSPAVAALRLAGRVAARVGVAARYPAEYEAIGNDRRAMRELAARTGGSVVEAADTRPLPIPRARGATPLTSLLAAAGAACVALALVWWRAT